MPHHAGTILYMKNKVSAVNDSLPYIASTLNDILEENNIELSDSDMDELKDEVRSFIGIFKYGK